jgi:hypothetical protein
MDRKRFLTNLMRYVLLILLAGIALFAGRRAVIASYCDTCPGKGICVGKTDCTKYISR